MIDKVLVPTDGSPLSERILATVEALAARRAVEVKLVRVADGFEYDDALLRGVDARSELRSSLDPALARVEKAGMRGSVAVAVGDPATEILKVANEWSPHLIAMATHGRSGADLWVRGSVAQRLLRRARQPVLVANPRALGDKPRFERILVPLDGSDASAHVLPLVQGLARAFGSEVILFHAVEGRALPSAGPTSEAQARDLLRLATERASLADLRVRTVTAKGAAAYAILEAAKNEKADLVAIATHGRTGASRWVFGSVAEHVVQQCRAPLLVVRTGGLDAEGGR